MNQQQRKYALARVHEIKLVKLASLKKECTVEAVYLSEDKRLDAFKKGQFKVKKDATKITHYTDVVGIVDFDAESKEKFDAEKYKKQSSALEKAANRVADEIMLGDAQEAMRLLEKFEA